MSKVCGCNMLCGKPLLQSFHIRALNRGPGPFMSVYLTVQGIRKCSVHRLLDIDFLSFKSMFVGLFLAFVS